MRFRTQPTTALPMAGQRSLDPQVPACPKSMNNVFAAFPRPPQGETRQGRAALEAEESNRRTSGFASETLSQAEYQKGIAPAATDRYFSQHSRPGFAEQRILHNRKAKTHTF
jgi:hypothetical protein